MPEHLRYNLGVGTTKTTKYSHIFPLIYIYIHTYIYNLFLFFCWLYRHYANCAFLPITPHYDIGQTRDFHIQLWEQNHV